MNRREVMLECFEIGSYDAVAKARLRFKNKDGVVQGGGLSLRAVLSDQLHERIRFEIEKELAAAIGADVETYSDGTVRETDVPF